MSIAQSPASRHLAQCRALVAGWSHSLALTLSQIPLWAYVCFIAATIALLLILAPDYGQSWDTPFSERRALATYNYYFGGFDAQRLRKVASGVGLYYGSVADVLIKLAQDTTPDAARKLEIRTTLQALITFSSLIAVFLIAVRVVSKPLALVAVALVAATPVFFGHAFINPKDNIFASGLLWSLYGILACFGGGRRPSYGALVGLGILIGAFASYRYLGVYLFILVPLVAIVLPALRPDERAGNSDSSLGSKLRTLTVEHTGGFGVLFLAFVVSYLICMPDLLSNLRLSEFVEMIRVFAHYPWNSSVLYFGEQVSAQALPWHYLWGYLLVGLPLYYHFFLATLLLGALLFPRTLGRELAEFRRENYDAFSTVIALLTALLLPLALIIFTRPVLYDGVRHMLFIVPLLCMLLYFGFVGIVGLTSGVLAATMSLVAVLLWGQAVVALVRLHPYEYAYYNPLVKPAGKFELDYWATSFRELASYLNDYARDGKTEKIKLFVCGPPYGIFPFLDLAEIRNPARGGKA